VAKRQTFQRSMASRSNRAGRKANLGTVRGLLRAGNVRQAESLLRQTVQAEPSNLEAKRLYIEVLRRTGRVQDGLTLCGQVLQVYPSRVEFLDEACMLLQMAGRMNEAMNVAQRATGVAPESPVGWFHAGQILARSGRPADAANALRQGLERTGSDPRLERLLGQLEADLGRTGAALDIYERLCAAAPDDVDLAAERASVRLNHGDVEQAIAEFDEVLARAPGHPRAIAGRAQALESAGRFEDSAAALEPALPGGGGGATTATVDPQIAIAFARLARRLDRVDEAVALIEPIVSETSNAAPLRSQAAMALGTLEEHRGNYDAAWSAWATGNALLEGRYDRDIAAKAADEIIEAFSAERIASMARADNDDELPVYIVGMPRSGTTLVEQIIAAHPDAVAGGERHDLREVGSRLSGLATEEQPGLAGALARLDQETADRLASDYLGLLHDVAGPDAKRFTDKNPFNYMQLGVISRLVPKARVIHCVRDPLDTCLSCFATRLGAKNAYATDLDRIGELYKAYRRLMDHWTATLDLAIHEVVYEDLVRDPETGTRALLDFLGLDFDERCLRFHEVDRVVMTASMDQVRRPVYESSIGRHAHFAEQLAGLRTALGDLVA